MARDYSHLLTDLKRAETKTLEKLNPDQKLSLCMIVKNEEKYLPGALESVQGVVDEIIIVDTGSTDKTVEIAREYGAKVYFRPWDDDFAAARNESLKHATGQWVLIMDADEKVPGEMKNNLRALLVDTEQFLSYSIFIKNHMENRGYESFFGHYLVRLFRKTPESKFQGTVHEQLYPSYGAVRIPSESFYLDHLGYADASVVNKKQQQRNRPLIQQQLEKFKGKNDAAYSFYAFYMGTSADSRQERLRWLKESVEAEGAPQDAPHVQVAFCQILKEYYAYKKYQEGLHYAESQMEAIPWLTDYQEFMEYLGILYLANQQYDLAIASFERVMLLQGSTEKVFAPVQSDKIGSWGTCLNLVLAYKLKGDLEQARVYAEKALKLYTAEDKDIILSRISLLLDDQSVAENYFSEILLEENDYSEAHIKNLSNHYLRQGQPHQALFLQHQAYPLDKVEKNANTLALNYIDQQQFHLAKQVFDAIQTLSPNSRLFHIGTYYVNALEQGDLLEADFVSKELTLATSVSEYKLLLHMAIMFSLDEDSEALCQCLENLGEKYYAGLRRALISQKTGDIQGAIRILEALIREDESRFDAYIQLGNILLGQGDFVAAEKVFNLACQYRKTDWYAYYGYALGLAGQDQLENAKRALSMAARLSSGNDVVMNLMELILAQEAQQVSHISSQ